MVWKSIRISVNLPIHRDSWSPLEINIKIYKFITAYVRIQLLKKM